MTLFSKYDNPTNEAGHISFYPWPWQALNPLQMMVSKPTAFMQELDPFPPLGKCKLLKKGYCLATCVQRSVLSVTLLSSVSTLQNPVLQHLFLFDLCHAVSDHLHPLRFSHFYLLMSCFLLLIMPYLVCFSNSKSSHFPRLFSIHYFSFGFMEKHHFPHFTFQEARFPRCPFVHICDGYQTPEIS